MTCAITVTHIGRSTKQEVHEHGESAPRFEFKHLHPYPAWPMQRLVVGRVDE